MNFKNTFLGLVLLSAISACQPKDIKVACVGDSITEGYGLHWQSITSYPVKLDSILGENYQVFNFGRSATTLQIQGNFPYWSCKEFSNVFASQPDIIVLKLGTNDTKPENWNREKFEKDYQALIDTFRTISSNPKLYLCKPVPVFESRWGINDSTVVEGVLPTIDRIASRNNLPMIDLYESMKDQDSNFPDGIHPNETAVTRMAELVAEGIKK